MANISYTTKIRDGNNIYYDLPKDVFLPEDSSKYITIPWRHHYTMQKLSHWIYGSVDYVWLLLKCNETTNPWESKDKVRFLHPDYLSEIELIG